MVLSASAFERPDKSMSYINCVETDSMFSNEPLTRNDAVSDFAVGVLTDSTAMFIVAVPSVATPCTR